MKPHPQIQLLGEELLPAAEDPSQTEDSSASRRRRMDQTPTSSTSIEEVSTTALSTTRTLSSSLIRLSNFAASDTKDFDFVAFDDDDCDDDDDDACRIRQEERRRQLVVWGLSGGLVALCLLGLLALLDPSATTLDFLRQELSSSGTSTPLSRSIGLRGEAPPTGLLSYLNLFYPTTKNSNLEASSSSSPKQQRNLAETKKQSGSLRDPQLVIAGKMFVEDAPCNIAQFNLKSNAWSLTERVELSLYNSYSGGVVYSLLANHTTKYQNQHVADDTDYTTDDVKT
jgi:hypothetical protein